MSFSFGFSGNDVEEEEDDQEKEVSDERTNLAKSVEILKIQTTSILIAPKAHTLAQLLHGLPSQISYNFLSIPHACNGQENKGTQVPRRSVFDIRTQLMVEANPEENDNEELLAGLDRGDLSSGVYEGGFKTWECAVDLASLTNEIEIDQDLHVIELGAGSAIPSLVILKRLLRFKDEKQTPRRLHFTLCDYNEDVLRLTTAPNVFLAHQATSRLDEENTDSQEQEIEDIGEATVDTCLKALKCAGATFSFISGAWGEEFAHLVHMTGPISSHEMAGTLIIASETIYSPETTRVFAKMLLQLLRRSPSRSKAWIAAKKIYFGVGGGVEEFMEEVRRQDGSLRLLLDVKGAGVGRVVLEVTANQSSGSAG